MPGVLPVVAAVFVAPAALRFALARHEDAQPPIIETGGLALLASLYAFLWAATSDRVCVCSTPQALALTATCAVVRFNTFVWLAPTMALGALVGWRRFAMRSKQWLTLLGLLGLVLLLVALSLQALRTDAGGFLFSYIESAQDDQGTANL